MNRLCFLDILHVELKLFVILQKGPLHPFSILFQFLKLLFGLHCLKINHSIVHLTLAVLRCVDVFFTDIGKLLWLFELMCFGVEFDLNFYILELDAATEYLYDLGHIDLKLR